MRASGVVQTKSALQRSSLTKREQDILELVAFGLSNKEIARQLRLSPRTVEVHVDHVLRKLDVPTRSRAVSEALRVGLLGDTSNSAVPNPRDIPPHNLQFQFTTFVDRDEDVADLKALLDANRLVTICGAGGVGKTRTASHLGVELLNRYPDGAWFCDFSPVPHGDLASSVVAKALGIRRQQDRPLAESIIRALKRKHALLIFDNCEHVLQAAAELADEVLHNAPNVRILATSRQPLGIIGENLRRLPSLAVPGATAALKAEGAMRYAAIALFVDRAQSLAAGFTLSDDNAPIVAEICRRLDGIPLAIELAATRVNAMSLPRLAQSLDVRFKVLTAGNRTALPRHQTLRALIDWSYELLTGEEQRLFNRLGIFAGGFGSDAAIAVCGGHGVDSNRACEVLASLVDKSLLVADIGGASERYRLLESTRVYALEKLASDERDRLSRRHAEYFCDEALAADSHQGLGSTASFLASVEMEPELDNYRAALEWALTRGGDPKLGGTLAGALYPFWLETAPAEGHYWIRRAQANLDESALPIVAGRLWFALSALSVGKYRRDCARRAFSLFESAGEDYWAARARYHLAAAFYQMGRFDEAAEENTRALELMRSAEQHRMPALLAMAAAISRHRQDKAEARELFAQAFDACRALGDELGTGALLLNFAELEFADGDVERALSLGGEALEMCRRYKPTRILAIANNNIAAYRIALGDIEEARGPLRQVLRFARRQDALTVATALQHVALLGALSGHAVNAGRLIGYLNAQLEQLGYQREYTEKWSYEKLVAALHAQMSDPEIEMLAAEGAQWSEERATEEALKLSAASPGSGST